MAYPLHPSVLGRIDAQYAAFYNTYLANNPPTHLQPLSTARAAFVSLKPGTGPLLAVGHVQDLLVPRNPLPALTVRCFTPQGPVPDSGWPVLLYFHGGGWVLGNRETENTVATNICVRASCVVVTVEYRLAPEDPFPAAVQDAWDSLVWVRSAGASALSLNVDRLAVGGSSAGANLAAVVCQRDASQRCSSSSPPIRLQLLSVPVVDNTATIDTSPSWSANQHTPSLPADKMTWFRNLYLPDEQQRHLPEASPLLWKGDWASLPPAVVLLAELDVLLDEGKMFAQKLADAGVDVDVHIFKGQPHPFLALDKVLDDGRRAMTYFCEAMARLALSSDFKQE
ncbi:hypothetical protein CDD82_7048 [Ophiocordyceps australis]|uniref:Alpha/beta hydrolase fold-3 domain-containing protein n=1 Tax=Ophiocordyceps australis TaxID=1399860 RepID=A0A2C5YUG7_9HYPO|nr:hypothetical protein CDD82_7048 [Ophiocordyceps australis]